MGGDKEGERQRDRDIRVRHIDWLPPTYAQTWPRGGERTYNLGTCP